MVEFTDTAGQAEFRAEVVAFVEQHHPEELAADAMYGVGLGGDQIGKVRGDARRDMIRPWRQAMVDKGWIAPAWPKQYGGADLSVMEQFILNETFAEMRASRVGVPDVGSTIMVHGSDEMKKEFLPKMVHGEDIWCQGYSEPGSGSDLASLQTRAKRDGDDYVINGQKIWTSGAAQAQWMFGLFRTDPEAPKHRGISYLLLSMDTPGLTVRPLQQITDSMSFNEVFFEDVRVPAKNIIGEENRGWYVGATHLDFERSSIGSAIGIQNTLDDLKDLLLDEQKAESGRSRMDRMPSVRSALAQRYVEAETAKMFSYRVISMQNRGEIPNYEASVQKVFTSEMKQRIANTAVQALGLYGQLHGREDDFTPMRSRWSQGYLATVSETIGAGTSEVQRNVIATRGLGLPRG
ncbi:MAG TPA: acyl-CoA dehydrogenase family protein [Dehalococcoidia bacterium]|nr:acyl-CoA dehydrogenase family protein [Dehalococcoidia bacterium]